MSLTARASSSLLNDGCVTVCSLTQDLGEKFLGIVLQLGTVGLVVTFAHPSCLVLRFLCMPGQFLCVYIYILILVHNIGF